MKTSPKTKTATAIALAEEVVRQAYVLNDVENLVHQYGMKQVKMAVQSLESYAEMCGAPIEELLAEQATSDPAAVRAHLARVGSKNCGRKPAKKEDDAVAIEVADKMLAKNPKVWMSRIVGVLRRKGFDPDSRTLNVIRVKWEAARTNAEAKAAKKG